MGKQEKKKVAVVFPGIGYTCDKPLLYYSGKIAAKNGYEVIPVPYGNFPPKVKGDRAKMEESFRLALEQSRDILAKVCWEDYEEILFIGKSVGTIVGLAYAQEKGLSVRGVLFTPLADTFRFVRGECTAFHGTKDPWANTQEIIQECQRCGIPLDLYDSANHSLETGDFSVDVSYLARAMEGFTAFITAS